MYKLHTYEMKSNKEAPCTRVKIFSKGAVNNIIGIRVIYFLTKLISLCGKEKWFSFTTAGIILILKR